MLVSLAASGKSQKVQTSRSILELEYYEGLPPFIDRVPFFGVLFGVLFGVVFAMQTRQSQLNVIGKCIRNLMMCERTCPFKAVSETFVRCSRSSGMACSAERFAGSLRRT
jgi:hypothetical protein